jgi:hypothetical protein
VLNAVKLSLTDGSQLKAPVYVFPASGPVRSEIVNVSVSVVSANAATPTKRASEREIAKALAHFINILLWRIWDVLPSTQQLEVQTLSLAL